jgi:hypothetical protein
MLTVILWLGSFQTNVNKNELLCRLFSNYRNEMNADKYQRLDTSKKGALLGLKWSFQCR